jgi:hypothetical protein
MGLLLKLDSFLSSMCRYDSKADVYSYSVLMWEFFHWEEPYPDLAVFQIVQVGLA